MSDEFYVIAGILIFGIVVCLCLKAYTKKKLESIDGLAGVTCQKQEKGRIVGGIFDNRKR